ncbi:hypothetical protein [Microlunatus parietis]|uniref:ABC-type sugar transport system ATPase subunit n=1 Tax=Microlunatus parietis TaxID=682979 RepID=A0A7Y9IED1_9ACTN|nr:hypothetical protein [Microlunatus parietis]NYE74978.1 ABC-type sugar transport system ATPase subunit [Microlunatus parietis]
MTSLEHVLWIGGPSGSGKTTAARLLARRYGFRWHSSDTKTWDHRDRAIAAGDQRAIIWESLTVAERSALSLDQTRQLEHDRRGLTLEDLAALPDRPSVITDGTPFTPDVVGPDALRPPVHAVWLFADARIRAARNRGRGWGGAGGPADLDRAARMAEQVDAAGGTKIITNDHESAEQTVDAVVRVCADWLHDQPRATSTEERRALIREGNAAIVGQYRAGLARPWATTRPEEIVRAFDCECAAPGCTALIDLPLTAFPEPFGPDDPLVLAPGHGR